MGGTKQRDLDRWSGGVGLRSGRQREPSKRERRSHRDCEGVEVKLVYSEESEKVSGWLHTSREAKFLRPHPGRHQSLHEFFAGIYQGASASLCPGWLRLASLAFFFYLFFYFSKGDLLAT